MRGALLLTALVALAGCMTPAADEPPVTPTTDAAPAAAPPLVLEAAGCEEGGGHSVHPEFENYLPTPWEPADVLDDVGDVPLTSEWWSHPMGARPEEGNTMGNWHVTVVCESWTLNGVAKDLVFGYVGMRVEPPPFDDPANPAERHYLVTVMGSSDSELNEILHTAGFHATASKGSVTNGLAGTMRTILDTEDHGIYDSIWKPKEKGAMPAGITRLWWQMEAEDGTFRPIALDLATASPGKHIVNDGYGYFSHFGTSDHAFIDNPQPIPPGVAGEIPALHWSGHDRTITLGPRPDVQLEEAYIHL